MFNTYAETKLHYKTIIWKLLSCERNRTRYSIMIFQDAFLFTKIQLTNVIASLIMCFVW